jgi:hypothetical protein
VCRYILLLKLIEGVNSPQLLQPHVKCSLHR